MWSCSVVGKSTYIGHKTQTIVWQGSTNPLARLPGASENDARASISQRHLPVRASGYFPPKNMEITLFLRICEKINVNVSRIMSNQANTAEIGVRSLTFCHENSSETPFRGHCHLELKNKFCSYARYPHYRYFNQIRALACDRECATARCEIFRNSCVYLCVHIPYLRGLLHMGL